MAKKNIFSAVLAVLLTAALVAVLSVIPVFADDGEEAADAEQTTEASDAGEAAAEEEEEDDGIERIYDEAEAEDADGETVVEEEKTINYITTLFRTPEEKLETMELKLSLYGYELYYEDYTGEVAYRNTKTGEILFTNPYDVANCGGGASEDTKMELLSQIVVNFYQSGNEAETVYNSYQQAALRNQINFKYVKNGIRVEYAIGRAETRRLVPRMIEKSVWETELFDLMADDKQAQKKMIAFYELKDKDDPTLTDAMVIQMQATYPITEDMAVYVWSETDQTEGDFNLIEGYIKKYCPEFTYERLNEVHEQVSYEVTDESYPLFRMALEYYLEEDGLSIRLPANSVRFDESKYTLTSIKVLPFFGASSSKFTGYTFIPDGSGALIRYEELRSALTLTGSMYGSDYTYQTLKLSNQETMRMPVFGLIENYDDDVEWSFDEYLMDYDDEEKAEKAKLEKEEKLTELLEKCDNVATYIDPKRKRTVVSEDDEGNTVETDYNIRVYKGTKAFKADRGFFAIIEEGDTLCSISTNNENGANHKYNSVYASFTTRAYDSANLGSALASMGGTTSFSVTSKKRYTGSFKLRIVMLTDETLAEENGLSEDDYYPVSYLGMAQAYQDYLVKKGTITKFTEEDVSDQLPMYIESFGSISTSSTFLTFPVQKWVAMTTFEDIRTMYDELAAEGIHNVNFKLFGFTNNGVAPYVPDYVEFEKTTGGKNGYTDLVKYAQEKGFGVYPDFDFMYERDSRTFGTFNFKKDDARSINGYYVGKRSVGDSSSSSSGNWGFVISPLSYMKLYKAFYKDMSKVDSVGISVSTFGSDINSDFNKLDPITREDGKAYITEMLAQVKEDFGSVLEDGGNVFTIPYVDHILNAPINSSHFTNASNVIPFFGMVFHGYVNYAGTPTNMVGETKTEMMRMIESGAAPYFVLSYDHTELLRDTRTMSRYYSVDYKIWKDDVIALYNEINDAIGGLQTQRIVNHEFLVGTRETTDGEIQAIEDRLAAEDQAVVDLDERYAAKLEREARHKAWMTEAGYYDPASEIEEEEEVIEVVQVDQLKGETFDALGLEKNKKKTAEEEDPYEQFVIDNGSIVRVTYEDGTQFVLNYNSFTVEAEGLTIPGFSYLKID